MSDGAISIKLAHDYEMGAVQKQLEDYGTGEDIIRNDDFFPDISLSALNVKQDIVNELTTNWLHFMDDVSALEAERRSGGV